MLAATLTLRQRAALWLYANGLRAATPLLLLRLLWRSRAEPGYRHALGERLGRYREGRRPMPGALWLHAVSLGETRAAAALVDALREARPGLRLLLTHGTATGREAGQALLRGGDLQAWLPFDTPGATARFIARFRPAVGVLMETEVWPGLLRAAAAHSVPMVLGNARLSEHSRRQGERFAALLHPAVESLAMVLAQTEADAERLRSAGARDVRVPGNLKFDVTPSAHLLARGRLWRAGLDRPVLLAAVTREGEEAALLAAWRERVPAVGGRAGTAPLLVIVPRHPQRFDAVATLVEGAGLRLARRSSWADAPPPAALAADVWLGDSLGEMPAYYALAQVALLGGSFEPLGGQNLIEAAACGCPLVMGPHTFNFAEAARLSLAAGASLRAGDIGAGLREALALLGSDTQYAMAARAMGFAAQHRGAGRRMASAIVGLIDAAAPPPPRPR